MGSQVDKSIGDNIRRIVGMGHVAALSGVVQNVADDNTVTVLLTDDAADMPTDVITLSVLPGNIDGMYGLPSAGADCIVVPVDGPGKWELLKASKYDKVIAQINGVVWEMDANQVQVKQGDGVLTMKDGKFSMKNGSNDYKTVMDSFFRHVLALTVPTGTGPSGPPINSADFTRDQTDFDSLFF